MVPELRFRSSGTISVSSPGWTRTNNPPVNSRMLCQLSYRGQRAGRRQNLSNARRCLPNRLRRVFHNPT